MALLNLQFCQYSFFGGERSKRRCEYIIKNQGQKNSIKTLILVKFRIFFDSIMGIVSFAILKSSLNQKS